MTDRLILSQLYIIFFCLLLNGCAHKNENKLLDSIRVSSSFHDDDAELYQCKEQIIRYVNVYELCTNEFLEKKAKVFEMLILNSIETKPSINKIKFYLEKNKFVCKEKQINKINNVNTVSINCKFLHRSTAPSLIGSGFDGYYEWSVYAETGHLNEFKSIDVNIIYRKNLNDE